MKQDYLIAGHHIRVEGDSLTEAVEAIPGFSVFKTAMSGEPLCRFTTSAREMPAFEKELYQDEYEGVMSHFGRHADGYALKLIPPASPPLHLWMEENGRVAYIAGNNAPHLLRFACWIAYGVATTPFQTIAVHSSAIRYRNRAVLFLGESGTGKSTHTRLWRRNIEGAALLNDDSPIVRIIDGKPQVYGSPWSGKTPCYKNESYPLAACVRLSQAPYNEIKRLGVAGGYGALHPSCPPCFAYDDALYDHISHVLSDLLAATPVYHLACLPDTDAARLSCQTIFGAETSMHL